MVTTVNICKVIFLTIGLNHFLKATVGSKGQKTCWTILKIS